MGLSVLTALPAWCLRAQVQTRGQQEESIRRGILYFLSNIRTESGLMDRDALTLANDAQNAKKYGEYTKKASKKTIKNAEKELKKYPLVEQLIEGGQSLVNQLVEMFVKPTAGTKFGKASITAAKAAGKWLVKQVPEIVKSFLRTVLKDLASVT